jgi:phage gp46-like protein
MSGELEMDILLEDTPDGGDIRIENRMFMQSSAYRTAIYLSLFGGNTNDSGKVQNSNTWWGNMLSGVSENEKLVSRFQEFVFGMPMTTKNILEAEERARLDLRWIVDTGLGEAAEVSGSAVSRNRFALTVCILAGGKSVAKEAFTVAWKSGA